MTFIKRLDKSSPAIAPLFNETVLQPISYFADAPATRRRFLTGLLAGAGSLALAACGGGGGGGTTGTATNASTNSGTSSGSASGSTGSGSSSAPGSAQSAQASSESASGTTVPPSASITDSSGAKWTLSSGAALRAGANTNCPLSVAMLLYWNHTVYAEDASGNWQVFSNNAWTASADPRGTTAASAVPATALFYGMNGHMAWTTSAYSTLTPAQQLAILKDLGVTNYRVDVAGSGMAQVVANALTGAFANSGVSILPCINPQSYDQTASETDAYNLGYQLAVSIATPLKGLVSYIECGNELDANGLVSNAGNSPADYNPAYWPAYRGVIRGMIDGVKSVDPTIKCGVNVGIPLAYTALQMLWTGQSPNGSATASQGATPVQWDITMYHWYETSGDMTRAGQNANINVLEILAQSFGVPIWLTEWGFSLADSASGESSYVTQTLNEYYSVRDTYNLQSIMMYELIDTVSGDTYGLIEADGVTQKPAYSAFKSFTAANAV